MSVSERYIAEYKIDAAGLGVREATIHLKAHREYRRNPRHH